METYDLMWRLGKSKAEKLEEQFVRIHKETAFEIIRLVGEKAFVMWFYLESKCYGNEKIHAYPKLETMAKDLGVSKRTVERWQEQLEKVCAIKRIPAYTKAGYRTSNLILVNAEFPEIPVGWETMFQEGVIIDQQTIIARNEHKEIASDISVRGITKDPTKLSGASDSTRQNCQVLPDKTVRDSMTKLSGSNSLEIPCESKGEPSFFEGGIRKDKEEKKNMDGWLGEVPPSQDYALAWNLLKDNCERNGIDKVQSFEFYKVWQHYYQEAPIPIVMATIRELMNDKWTLKNGKWKEQEYENVTGLFHHRMKSWRQMAAAYEDVDRNENR